MLVKNSIPISVRCRFTGSFRNALIFCIAWLFLCATSYAQKYNGFDISNALVNKREIVSGGPPRDAIPPIDNPVFSPPSKTQRESTEQILGLNYQGIQKAYPLDILIWHEIVNDLFASQAVVISYCPLCASGVAFKSDPKGFGVSGLLYNSDVLLYDRKTESLWSQIAMQAISGERKSEKLSHLSLHQTTLKSWLERHPESLVLTEQTGFQRNYNENPYAGYEKSPHVYFDVKNKAPKVIHPKSLVLGIKIENIAKAYPLETFKNKGLTHVKDKIGNHEITFKWDDTSESAEVIYNGEAEIEIIQLYWFAWYAFHPDTEIFK